ncbi:hypothetical protein TPE_1559 [Treponema pedis str. T A4]|uniref:Uncharacterized protein n=1 Tax=Treponema pedis str. T A4 TaxID=1291379 RepID=S6A8L8_9SPIR|nr:hypothetical protein TPE_1559 [Treponema pedis str. T A4]
MRIKKKSRFKKPAANQGSRQAGGWEGNRLADTYISAYNKKTLSGKHKGI